MKGNTGQLLQKSHLQDMEGLQWASRIASIAAIAIGTMVIVGWMFDIGLLKSVLPGLVTMKANTAFGFIFGGCCLWLWHRESESASSHRAALACATIVLLIGLLTLIQYSFDIDLGIDQLVFKESVDAVATAAPAWLRIVRLIFCCWGLR